MNSSRRLFWSSVSGTSSRLTFFSSIMGSSFSAIRAPVRGSAPAVRHHTNKQPRSEGGVAGTKNPAVSPAGFFCGHAALLHLDAALLVEPERAGMPGQRAVGLLL